jgi:hypothetical protein
MKYEGKLYGHIGGEKYFPLVYDTKDVDEMRKALETFMSAATVDPDMSGRREPRAWAPTKLVRAWKLADDVFGRIETKEMAGGK